MISTNKEAFEKSSGYFPGGVNSPVRAFKSVRSVPPFIASGKGAYIKDIEGKSYIDYVGSWGPLILGHAHDSVVKAVQKAAEAGMTFGAPTLKEMELAALVRKAFPTMEIMRLVSSGTEATMSAIRLARGATKRSMFVKCDGCYHGHADSLLVSAGSGVATLGIPGCPGITDGTASDTLTVAFNDLEGLKAVFQKYPEKIAAVILEPVCGNMGVVRPNAGYLEGVLETAHKDGALVIFDEVMTGFRNCFGGVQTEMKLQPDLTCLGKIVGGGLPLAVYGGKESIMRNIAPDGPVYQAGTLSGNPLAVSSGIATLSWLQDNQGKYSDLISLTKRLSDGLAELMKKHDIPGVVNQFGSMFTGFFTGTTVTDFLTAKTTDTERFAKWFRGMLMEGVYLAPSQFEAGFVSFAHTDKEIDETLCAAEKVLSQGI